MDLTPYVRFIVFIHVLAAFVFAAGHGVSLFVAFQVRRETDRARIGALLDASGAALVAAYIALLVLLIAGVLAGIVLQSFGRWWIWVSLGALVAIGVLMTPLGINHFNRHPSGDRAADSGSEGHGPRSGSRLRCRSRGDPCLPTPGGASRDRWRWVPADPRADDVPAVLRSGRAHRSRHSALTREPEQLALAGKALELVQARVLERELGAVDEVHDRRRDEDFARLAPRP